MERFKTRKYTFIFLVIFVLATVVIENKISDKYNNNNDFGSDSRVSLIDFDESTTTWSRDGVSGTDNWRVVVKNTIYVYSAHLDSLSNESMSIINIVGAMRENELVNWNNLGLSCHVWTRQNGSMRDPVGTYNRVKVDEVINLDEEREKAYRSVLYTCVVHLSPDVLTDAMVSLSPDTARSQDNPLLIHQNYRRDTQYNYTLCVQMPFFGDIFPRSWIVEYFEINRIFGAQKFLIHNMSMGHYLDPYVKYYQDLGLLDIVPWNLPEELMDGGLLWAYLQHAMIADCEFRMQRWTKYLVMSDMDELIVPRHADDVTWADMTRRSGCDVNVVSYSVRMIFFGLLYQNTTAHAQNLITMDKTERNMYIWPYPKRMKYIANTFLSRSMSTHCVKNAKGKRSCVLPPSIGGVHHYREDAIGRKHGRHRMSDYSTLKYGERLKQATLRVHSSVEIN